MPTIDVPVQTPVNQYTANPSQTVFAYTFLLFSDADVQVIVDGVTKTLTTDYTVSGVLNESGGNITFGTGLAGGESVTIKRKTSIGRDSQYQADGTFDAAPLERDLDKLITIAQELRRDTDAAVKLNIADLTSSGELPLPEANKALVWSGSAPYSLVNGPTITDIANAATNAATATTKAAEAAASAAAAAASAASVAEIDTDRLADGAVTTAKIEDSAVTTAKIADANVTTAKILDANVTTAKLADLAVTEAKLASGAVTSAKLNNSAVTGQTEVVVAAGDSIIFSDVSDSGNLKRDTVQGILDLVSPSQTKAWVNFQGTGTVTIRDSYNVSSITDNGTGNYTVNLSVTMANNDYSAVAQAGRTASTLGSQMAVPLDDMTTTSFKVVSNGTGGTSPFDVDLVCVTVAGDLA